MTHGRYCGSSIVEVVSGGRMCGRSQLSLRRVCAIWGQVLERSGRWIGGVLLARPYLPHCRV